MSDIPKTMKAVAIYRDEHQPPGEFQTAKLVDVPTPVPSEGEVLVKLHASGFNHRDIWIRQGLYPNFKYSTEQVPSIFGSDGVGTVVSPNSSLNNKKILVSPMVNWNSDPIAPDVPGKPFGILGNEELSQCRGTFAEYIVVPENSVVLCPEHIASKKDWASAAALPLSFLTAYRALFTKGRLSEGQNVLITGIGGGTALAALQLAVAIGANVYVTSGSHQKIAHAQSLGAINGVNYKNDDWNLQLKGLLPRSRPFLDVVIDSAGGNIVQKISPVLKIGGILVTYGTTSGRNPEIDMHFVIKNQEFHGSTMGSFAELKRAIGLVDKYKVHPVVSHVSSSLEQYEEGFTILKEGTQFGKVVIMIGTSD